MHSLPARPGGYVAHTTQVRAQPQRDGPFPLARLASGGVTPTGGPHPRALPKRAGQAQTMSGGPGEGPARGPTAADHQLTETRLL